VSRVNGDQQRASKGMLFGTFGPACRPRSKDSSRWCGTPHVATWWLACSPSWKVNQNASRCIRGSTPRPGVGRFGLGAWSSGLRERAQARM